MHSLRSRLFVLWAISLAACIAVAIMLVQLYQQSTAALIGRAAAMLPHACELICDRYQFYIAGWKGPVPPLDDAGLRRYLTAAVTLALAHQEGIEGGIWQSEAGPLAYAYPTYEGSGPKTDLPEAERERIRAINEASMQQETGVEQQLNARSQTLLLYGCPLSGPICGLTAWAMTRVQTASGYDSLRLGLGVLMALMLGVSGWLRWLMTVWTRHVRRIEAALAAREHPNACAPPHRRAGARPDHRCPERCRCAACGCTTRVGSIGCAGCGWRTLGRAWPRRRRGGA